MPILEAAISIFDLRWKLCQSTFDSWACCSSYRLASPYVAFVVDGLQLLVALFPCNFPSLRVALHFQVRIT